MDTFEIGIVEEGGLLRIALRGSGTYEHLHSAVAAIVTETNSREIWRVLCDATAVTPPPGAIEKFEAGVELAHSADRRMKMAVVARLETIDYIFQNVARNRGVSVRVFRDEGAALKWLLNVKMQ